jgi:hypothetical protein
LILIFAKSRTLSVLRFGDQGAAAFARALVKNTSLQSLDFGCEFVSSFFLKLVVK